jgi:transposase-like protein
MPLLNICAITGNNMVIQVGLVFLSSEKEADYIWATTYLRELMAENTIKEPYAIVTDRELALIRALKAQFPNSQHLLCRWHVNMNVLAKTRQFFPAPTRVEGRIIRHPRFQEFLSSWNSLLASSTEDLYRRQLVAMHAKYPTNAMKYCTDTWLI